MQGHDVVHCVRGFSRKFLRNTELWAALASAAIRCCFRMKPLEISSCINGFCKIELYKPQLWQTLVKKAIRCAPQMNSQNVVWIMWIVFLGWLIVTIPNYGKRSHNNGFSKVFVDFPNLWSTLAQTVNGSYMSFDDSRDLAKCVSGFSKASFSHDH